MRASGHRGVAISLAIAAAAASLGIFAYRRRVRLSQRGRSKVWPLVYRGDILTAPTFGQVSRAGLCKMNGYRGDNPNPKHS
eukprot:1176517-Prorocentrum_minimum.AAC.1